MEGTMTILIVDDSRIMRNLIKDYFIKFEIEHCVFAEAENGEDAFKLLQSRPIDLVLLDWNMPKLLGIDFLRMARQIDKYKNLPIVMITSETAKSNIIDALKAGANDYIIKPFSEDKFKEKITAILIKQGFSFFGGKRRS
jgi:two-component system chemotaxis response regulator CheY